MPLFYNVAPANWRDLETFSQFAKNEPETFCAPWTEEDNGLLNRKIFEYNIDQLEADGPSILVKIPTSFEYAFYETCQKIIHFFSQLMSVIANIPFALWRGELLDYVSSVEWFEPSLQWLQKIPRQLTCTGPCANDKASDGEPLNHITLEKLPTANRIILSNYALLLPDFFHTALHKGKGNGIPHPIESRSLNEEEIQTLRQILCIEDKDALIDCWAPLDFGLGDLACIIDAIYLDHCKPQRVETVHVEDYEEFIDMRFDQLQKAGLPENEIGRRVDEAKSGILEHLRVSSLMDVIPADENHLAKLNIVLPPKVVMALPSELQKRVFVIDDD